MTVDAKHQKHQRSQLRVVFDTNVLYNDSASDLVRREASALIRESKFDDLEIQWYLPEMVRHERRYQMQKRALELLPPIAKVEKLLGHNLAITEQILIESVEKVVSVRFGELGLFSLKLDISRVDWDLLTRDAVYRRPPFKDGETEKGFRDRIIVESFLQLVDDSPKTPKICRIVLVSGDALVAQAVRDRTQGSANTVVLPTLEELKGLINTLVSRVDEAYLAILKPKAAKLFLIVDDKSTLFYKERIRDLLEEKFATELVALPPGSSIRSNGTWSVSGPNFVKKTGPRIQWASRIEIETKASKVASQSPVIAPALSKLALQHGPSEMDAALFPSAADFLRSGSAAPNILGSAVPLSTLANVSQPSYNALWYSQSTIQTHKGTDVYEILWSVDISSRRELRRPKIDDIRHVALTWEQVT